MTARRSALAFAFVGLSGCNALFGIEQLSGDAGVTAKADGPHPVAAPDDAGAVAKPDARPPIDATLPDATDASSTTCKPTLDAGVAAPTCTPDGWCWLSPELPGYDLYAVSGACGDVWAAGASGALLHLQEDTWTGVTTPKTADLEAVFRVGPNDVWVGGGDLGHYDGSSWKSYGAGASGALIESIWGAGTADVWAAGLATSQAIVMHWDGHTWSHDRTLEQASTQFLALSGTGPADVWLAGDALYHWDGSAWTRATGTPAGCSFSAVYAEEPGKAWTVCAEANENFAGAYLLHGTPASWQKVDPGLRLPGLPAPEAADVWGSSSSDLWVLAGVNELPFPFLLEHFDGRTWTHQGTTPTSTTPIAGVSTAPGESFVVGSAGGILHSVGTTTRYEDPVVGTSVSGISGSSPTDVWIVGSGTGGVDAGAGSNALHFDGTRLTARPISGASELTAVYVSPLDAASADGGPSDDLVGAIGADASGHLAAWTWDGSEWLRGSGLPSSTARLLALTGAADGSLVAVGEGAGVYEYDGASWQEAALPPLGKGEDGGASALYAVTSDANGRVWAVGDGGLVLARDGGSWSVLAAPTTDRLEAVSYDALANDLYVAGRDGDGNVEFFVWHAGAWKQVTAPNETLGDLGSTSVGLWTDEFGHTWLLGSSSAIFEGTRQDTGFAWTLRGRRAGASSALTGVAAGTADMVWVGGSETLRYYLK